MTKEIRASIDIGSNSVLLLIGEVVGGKIREILKRSEVTSLGKELDKNKIFHSESMDATFSAIDSFVGDCIKQGVDPENIIATATEASRVALNAPDFFKKIKDKLGVKVHVITSEAEAYFSTKGILFDQNFEEEIITLMDIGGASTELINVNTRSYQILDTISMPVGSVRSSQWLQDQLFVQNLQKIFLDFRSSLDKFQTKKLYCVAGTVTSLGNMHLERKDFIEDDVHGLQLSVEDIESLFKKYSQASPDDFQLKFPFLGKRAFSIRGGLHLMYHISHRLLVKEIIISTYGLRYGTLLEGKINEEFLHGQKI